jgi:hypothetical protein
MTQKAERERDRERERNKKWPTVCATPSVPLKARPLILFPISFAMQPTKAFSVYTSKHLNINSISVSRADSLYWVIMSILNAIINSFCSLPYLNQTHVTFISLHTIANSWNCLESERRTFAISAHVLYIHTYLLFQITYSASLSTSVYRKIWGSHGGNYEEPSSGI